MSGEMANEGELVFPVIIENDFVTKSKCPVDVFFFSTGELLGHVKHVGRSMLPWMGAMKSASCELRAASVCGCSGIRPRAGRKMSFRNCSATICRTMAVLVVR